MHRRGYIRDNAGHLRTPFRYLAARLAVSASDVPNVTENCPTVLRAVPVLDQGETSGCTGCSVPTVIGGSLALAKAPLPFVPSQKAAYANGRGLDRAETSPGVYPPLKDIGAQPASVWRAVDELGLRAMVPLASRYSDLDPSTINDQETLAELQVERQELLVGDYGLLSTGAARVLALRQALANGKLFTAGIQADKDPIQNYKGGVLTASDLGIDSDHYVAGVDAILLDGVAIFLMRQSWGTANFGVSSFLDTRLPPSWKAPGHFLVDASVIDAMTDIVIGDVAVRS